MLCFILRNKRTTLFMLCIHTYVYTSTCAYRATDLCTYAFVCKYAYLLYREIYNLIT